MGKYRTCFVMGIQKALEYRFDFFMGYIGAVFPIFIQLSMWTAIYGATKDGRMFGYTYPQMVLYTFFVGVMGRFLSTGFEYEMNEDIKNGGLSKFIVKPINYYSYRGACFLGERAAVLGGFIAILCSLMICFGFLGYFSITLLKGVLFVFSLLFALLLNFGVYFCIGTSCFWLTEVSRIFPALSIIITIISGGIFPTDILGSGFNRVFQYLPFKYMMQLPVDILTGKITGTGGVTALGIQLLWVCVFIFISKFLWQRGIKKYVAAGG